MKVPFLDVGASYRELRQEIDDAMHRVLANAGVETLVHFPIAPYRQDAYSEMAASKSAWPISAELHELVVSLPIGPHLNDEQVQVVVDAVNAFCA